MVAGDVGWRTASHELLVRRSHLGSLAQLFHYVEKRTDVLLGSVERQDATNLETEVTTSSMPVITFWFARLSVDGNENSLARSSAIHNIVGVVAQRHSLAATAIKMVAL